MNFDVIKNNHVTLRYTFALFLNYTDGADILKTNSFFKNKRNITPSLASFAAIIAMLTPYTAAACTSILLPTTDGSGVYARTMEFGFELQSDAMVIPRGFQLSSTGADGKTGMKWRGKYAVVGLNALGVTTLVDGMNEKGLAGGVLYFPGYAHYAQADKSDPKKSLAPWDVLSWILTNYATVDEVKDAIQKINVIGVVQPQMGITPPLHYTIHDASGASLVIEPINGVLKLHDNPTGVLTNAPNFDWHLTNLKNYLKISSINAPDLKINGQSISPLGQGSGLLGIPGDPTPPSRFIRATAYSVAVEKQKSGAESVRLAEHIINNFDIPKGWIQDSNNKIPPEYTQWSTIADLKNKKYYVKTYQDQVLREISLSEFNLNAKDIKKASFATELQAPSIIFEK
ncbi:linear amide C-N hydrolase [Brucellaceae bacterium C25G]